MNNRERFANTLNFKPVDRLPVLEWAEWWGLTIERWVKEGLPTHFTKSHVFEIRQYFEMDAYRSLASYVRSPECPSAPVRGMGFLSNTDDYLRLKKFMYPEVMFDIEAAKNYGQQSESGDLAVSIRFQGFFWFPRELLGIEKHLYAFYDQPELIHMMNSDLVKFYNRLLDEFLPLCKPVFMYFMEDMSYNHGPMLSEAIFEEFLAPYYRQIVPRLKDSGIIPFVDSDGDVAKMIPWLSSVGIEGILPLERQAGVDIVALRQKHPKFKFIGAYDKMVMNKDEAAMRAEFERIFPVMKQGGYLPGVDHQTPPGVSLENYKSFFVC